MVLELDQNILIKYIGGLGLVLTGIFGFISKIILGRMQRSWEKKSNIQIENLKGEIAKSNSLINILTHQVGNGFQKILDKRVDAAEDIWLKTLAIEKNQPDTVQVLYQILQKHEFNNEFIESGNKEISLSLVEINFPEFVMNSSKIIDELAKYRPYLSEYLWTLIFSFHGFIGRTSFLLIDGYKKNLIKFWLEDKGVREILNSALTKEEIEFLDNSNIQPYLVAIDIFKTKILNELKKLISSDEFTENVISQVQKINQISKNLN